MKEPQILVVEDEKIVAMDIQSRLRRMGFGIAGLASSGAEAIQKAAETRPDLVLMDVMLHGAMDGVEAARHLREHFGIPVVYLTAYSDEDTLQKAKLTEPFGYITKPFRDRELRITLEMALYRHETEKRTKESEHWLSTMLHSLGEGVIATDAQGRVKLINSTAEALTGWTQAEAVGRELAEVLHIVEEARLGLGTSPDSDRRLISRSGREIQIQDRGASIRDEQGKVLGAVLVLRDITARKRLEQQLFLAQKMEAIGTLAGGVAHDFNNLLTVITGYADDLLQRIGAGEPMRKGLEEIRKSAESAGSLTQQLMAFSRRQVLRPKVLNLNSVLGDLGRMLRRLIGEDIELSVVLEPSLACVKADPGQLTQILMNLAVNARDAMPRGGRLLLKTANVVLDEDYVQRHVPMTPGPFVQISVSDNGCGMDEATRSRIFEPFFTTKGLGRGTGLGLSTVYGIVKQSGGFIWVYSEPEQGTSFKIYLPPVHEAAEPIERVGPYRATPRGTETILLVEDVEPLSEMTSAMLRQQGYTVLAARNGEEALQIGRDQAGTIHLLLTDVVMPGMSGIELASRFKLLREGVKVLYVSGYPAEEIGRRGVLLPTTAFLEKPFRAQILLHKLRDVLDGKDA